MLLKLLDETDQTWALGSNMFSYLSSGCLCLHQSQCQGLLRMRDLASRKSIPISLQSFIRKGHSMLRPLDLSSGKNVQIICSFIRKKHSMFRSCTHSSGKKHSMFRSCTLSSGKNSPCLDHALFHQAKTIHAQIRYLSSGKDNPYSDWACLPLLDSLTEFGRKLESLCPPVCVCLSVCVCLFSCPICPGFLQKLPKLLWPDLQWWGMTVSQSMTGKKLAHWYYFVTRFGLAVRC